jgi:hypothetical protein
MDKRRTTVTVSLAVLLVTFGSISPRPAQETIRCTSNTTSSTDVNFSSRDTVTRGASIRSHFCYNLRNIPGDDPLYITLEARSGEFDLLAVPRRTTSVSTTRDQLNTGGTIESRSRSSCQSFTIEDPARSYTVVVVARGSGTQRFSLTFGAGGSPAKTCPQRPGVHNAADTDVLAHMGWATGGAAGEHNVCARHAEGALGARLWAWSLHGPLDNGDLVRIHSIRDTYTDAYTGPDMTWSLGWFPGICSAQEDYLDEAEAISPSGERLEPLRLDFSIEEEVAPSHYNFVEDAYGVWLPPEAYLRPGVWQLVVDNSRADMSIYIDVPPADEPVVIDYEHTFWLAGYGPGERIKVVMVASDFVTSDTDGGSGSNVPQPLIVGEFDLRADANGYAVAEDPAPGLWEWGEFPEDPLPVHQYFFLGEWGNVAYTQPVGFYMDDYSGPMIRSATFDDVAELLLANYPMSQVCRGFMPSRLIMGDTARVTSDFPIEVYTGPSITNGVQGKIPGGSTVTVLEGPACIEETAWWAVNYQGMIGWTPEGFDSEYWLEPLP